MPISKCCHWRLMKNEVGGGERVSVRRRKISRIYQPQFNLHHKFKCQPMKMLQLQIHQLNSQYLTKRLF